MLLAARQSQYLIGRRSGFLKDPSDILVLLRQLPDGKCSKPRFRVGVVLVTFLACMNGNDPQPGILGPTRRCGERSQGSNLVNLSELGLEPLPADLARVEEALRVGVASKDAFLGDVATHLIAAGGKRLRPALTLGAVYAAKGLGAVPDDAIVGATAVELVHLGSLYHDDVIDEAETRRGVPSVNARWSNIVAILAGDYLLARSSAHAARLGAEVAGLLADTIGELCRGQVLELQHLFDATRTVDDYFSAIEGKTASLMATSCRIGGMVAGVPDPTLDALTSFGRHLGMCFQIVDDVLDITSSDETLGKHAGQDLVEGVYTLPIIYAMDGNDELRELLARPMGAESIDAVREVVLSSGAAKKAMDVAREHGTKAEEVLNDADGIDPEVCKAFGRLVESVVVRES